MAPAEFSFADVKKLNKRLREVVSEVTNQGRIAFGGTKGDTVDALEAATRGYSAGFELRGTDATGRARRDIGGEVDVVLLRKRSGPGRNDVWVGGYIEWEKLAKKQIRLNTLNWFFVVGRERADENMVLLRAEWFHDRSHPQPHWHVDRDIAVPRYGSATSDLGGTSSEDFAMGSLGRLHLPMSGWNNGPDYPTCWSHEETAKTDAFIEWSDRTIRVAADQIEHLLKRSGV
jgi:hypothetical protein